MCCLYYLLYPVEQWTIFAPWFNLRTSIYDGKSAYVGVKGQIIYDPPTAKGTVIKKIGFVEGSYLLFNPNGYALINK